MASAGSSPSPYDVLFSYNWLDRAEIQGYDRGLSAQSLKVCVDYRHLTPGRAWITEIEQAIRDVSAIAVFYGPHGFGDTQTLELQLAVALHKHVIPVILPGVREDPPLSFLTLRTWVDLRRDSFDRLIAAIRGSGAPGPVNAARRRASRLPL
jgi:ribosome modulation factor